MSPLKIGLWFLGALAGLSAPHILKAGLAPSWIEWLIRGSGGEAQGWQALGLICGILGVRDLLSWGAERYEVPILQRASDLISLLLIVGIVVVAIGFVALLGSLFLGSAIAPLSNVLPEQIGAHLRKLDREPGSFILAGAIVALMTAVAGTVYLRTRRMRAEGASNEDVIAEAFLSFAPFFVLTLIAFNTFVGFGIVVLGAAHSFPSYLGTWSSWADDHSGRIVGTATALSVLAPFLLHGLGLWRNRDFENKPRFVFACWRVFYVSLSIVAISIGLMFVAALVGSAAGNG